MDISSGLSGIPHYICFNHLVEKIPENRFRLWRKDQINWSRSGCLLYNPGRYIPAEACPVCTSYQIRSVFNLKYWECLTFKSIECPRSCLRFPAHSYKCKSASLSTPEATSHISIHARKIVQSVEPLNETVFRDNGGIFVLTGILRNII